MLTPIQLRTRRAKRALAARGMVEAVTWSFIAKPPPNCSAAGQAELALANPIASDLSDMRPSLLPGLVAAAQANADRGFADVALFEVGQIFRGDRPQDQFVAASGVRHGFASRKGHGPTLVRFGAWRMRSTPRPMRSRCWPRPVRRCRRCRSCRAAPSWLHPGRSGTIQIGPQNVLGYFGELHPRALEALGADGPVVGIRGDPRPHSGRQAEADPRQAGARTLARSSRCRATSPSSSIAASRPATSSARRKASTRS